MPRFIISGNYTAEAMKRMIANPSDREAATRALVEAAGGTLESFYITTGDNDFSMKVTTDDVTTMLAGLMVASASGAACNLKTVRAFTSDEFTEIQKKAGKIANAYKTP